MIVHDCLLLIDGSGGPTKQANQHPPTMTPQSGNRLRRCCLRIPKRTSCAGVWGWNMAARGSHCVPLSLTTTTTLRSGTALSTSTYFPVSENTWANLVGTARGGEHRHYDGGTATFSRLFSTRSTPLQHKLWFCNVNVNVNGPTFLCFTRS